MRFLALDVHIRVRSTRLTAASPNLEYAGARKPLHVSLLPNPSHLEAVNPVALGKTRAKQFALLRALQRAGATDCMPGDRVMCVQLHGDASFTGQGVIMEGLGLSGSVCWLGRMWVG